MKNLIWMVGIGILILSSLAVIPEIGAEEVKQPVIAMVIFDEGGNQTEIFELHEKGTFKLNIKNPNEEPIEAEITVYIPNLMETLEVEGYFSQRISLLPGEDRWVQIDFQAKKIGRAEIISLIKYWPEGEEENYKKMEPKQLKITVLPKKSKGLKEKLPFEIPGFEICSVIAAILIILLMRKR